MLVNAEETGVSDDTIDSIKEYWIDNGLKQSKLAKIRIVDKGYGYLRSWMDYTSKATIIKIGKFMEENHIYDSRDIADTGTTIEELAGSDYNNNNMEDDPMTLGWLDANFIKTLHNCYLCGGGRDECLEEVMLMFQIFDVHYNLISEFIY